MVDYIMIGKKMPRRIEGTNTFEHDDGTKEWRSPNGDLHRLDGPAVEFANGYKAWYVNNIDLPDKEVDQWVIDNNLSIPFDEATQVLFKLRWL
jgi:hypothetical protein